MTNRETHIEVLGTPRPNDRPLIAPYQLEGNRKATTGDTWSDDRVTLTMPTLVFQGEDSTPLYVEAKLRLTPAELDILMRQMHGIRAWMAEPPRDYQADAEFLVEQHIFTAQLGAGQRYMWSDGRSEQRYTAEQAVGAYEAEDGTVAELHEQYDAQMPEEGGEEEDGLTGRTLYDDEDHLTMPGEVK